MSDELIKKIDTALQRYYLSLNRRDYSDANGNGRFLLHCENNGFEDDDVEEELNMDPEECMLTDFDDNFPFPHNKQPTNENEKFQYVFTILQQCYNNPNYNGISSYSFQLEKNHFNLYDSNPNWHKIIEISKKLCPKICELTKPQGDLMKLLYISQHIIGQPYLYLLADTFCRDKIKHYLLIKSIKENEFKNQIKQIHSTDQLSITAKKLTLPIWFDMNKHTKCIKNWSQTHKEFDLTKAALIAYYHRICPLMNVIPTVKICENYRHICEYISAAVDFVYNLFEMGEIICPFQYDFVFAFDNVRSNTKMASIGIHNNESDDDSDSMDEKEEKSDYFDCFGNIKNRLRQANLEYYSKEINPNDDNLRFNDVFEKLQKNIRERGDEMKQYPHRHRFISVLDKRKMDKKLEITANDELIFCEAGTNCSMLPPEKRQCDDLWYFNSSKTCIIPQDKNYINENKENEKLRTQIINTDHAMKHGMLMLSFHVISVDEIRCYLYFGGAMMRFAAEDLRLFLRQFFAESVNDNIYVNDLIENIERKLIDKKFDAFYEENKTNINEMKQAVRKDLKENIEQAKKRKVTREK